MNPRKLRIPLGEWVEIRTTDGRSETGWCLSGDDEKLDIATTRQGFVASGSARLAFNADHIVAMERRGRQSSSPLPLGQLVPPRPGPGIRGADGPFTSGDPAGSSGICSLSPSRRRASPMRERTPSLR
jgi:hypothetical protein